MSLAPKIYLACPMNPKFRESEEKIAKVLRFRGYNVYFPAEFKVDDAWSLPNREWGLQVFNHDMEELDNAQIVILLYYGQEFCTGSAWEAGYAYAKGKKVIVVEMIGGIKESLMIANGSYCVLQGERELERYDILTGERMMTGTEQI